VALKRISKREERLAANKETFEQEIKAGMILKHHGIPQLKGYFESSKHFWLVMDYINGLDLVSWMEQRNNRPIPEHQAKDMFMEIVKIIKKAHSLGVAHLDIKLDNIMIDSEGKLHVIDWGLSCTEDSLHCFKRVGSPEYADPAIFRRKELPYNAFLSDIFSLGVVLFTLLYGQFPFDKRALYLMRNGFEFEAPPYPSEIHISGFAKELLEGMLEPNPDKRIDLENVEKHKWFSENQLRRSASLVYHSMM